MDPVPFDPDLAQSLKLSTALDAADQGNLFPSSVGWAAAASDGDVASTIQASLGRTYRPELLEVVRVPKLDRSTRPAVDMPVEDRLVYAALCGALRDSVHPGLVTFTGLAEEGQTYADFERYPIGEEDVRYVLEADAASFYEYIEHERLAEEVLGLTGRPDLAQGIVEVLERWMGRSFGLPQGPASSSILADVYISPATRTLARAGLRFARYSDDFRILASNWPEARRAQLILEAALRQIGLVVAPRKLRTPKIETYRESLERARDPRLPPVVQVPGAEELLEEEYEPGAGPDVFATIEQALAASGIIGELVESRQVGVPETRLARAALRRVRHFGGEVVYENLPRLLSRYAHITQAVSANLRAAMGTDGESRALQSIEDWLRRPWFKYPWQVGWVLYAANHAREERSTLGEWAAENMFDQSLPWFVRAQAAIAAARHADLPSIDRFYDLWERATDAARPDLLAAVAIGEPAWSGQFIDGAKTSVLLARVADLPASDYREWL
jgi:hypothetical protein